jgi:hypothetical protein
MEGSVWALAIFDDGDGPALYAGGSFVIASGNSTNRIAKWDGTNWLPLGTGVSSSTLAVAVGALSSYDGGNGPELYAGGPPAFRKLPPAYTAPEHGPSRSVPSRDPAGRQAACGREPPARVERQAAAVVEGGERIDAGVRAGPFSELGHPSRLAGEGLREHEPPDGDGRRQRGGHDARSRDQVRGSRALLGGGRHLDALGVERNLHLEREAPVRGGDGPAAGARHDHGAGRGRAVRQAHATGHGLPRRTIASSELRGGRAGGDREQGRDHEWSKMSRRGIRPVHEVLLLPGLVGARRARLDTETGAAVWHEGGGTVSQRGSPPAERWHLPVEKRLATPARQQGGPRAGPTWISHRLPGPDDFPQAGPARGRAAVQPPRSRRPRPGGRR